MRRVLEEVFFEVVKGLTLLHSELQPISLGGLWLSLVVLHWTESLSGHHSPISPRNRRGGERRRRAPAAPAPGLPPAAPRGGGPRVPRRARANRRAAAGRGRARTPCAPARRRRGRGRPPARAPRRRRPT